VFSKSAVTLYAVFSVIGFLVFPVYDAYAGNNECAFTFLTETKQYQVYSLEYRSLVTTLFPNNNRVYAEVFIPAHTPKPYPVVFVIPGLAEPTKFAEHWFCRALARRGIASVFVELPFQFHRRPYEHARSGQYFLSKNPAIIRNNYQQALSDLDQALAWVSAHPWFEHRRIGVLGISLGALIGLTWMGNNPAVGSGVIILGGAHLADIVWDSALTRSVVKKLVKQGITRESVARLWEPIEPIQQSTGLSQRKIVLYNARWDLIIPKKNVLALWDALPRAQKHWLYGSHYSAIFSIGYVARQSADFFKNYFYPVEIH
jgi:alpha-beta hydrolase superfamily lysophospholipase